ncbi:MAG: GntR family transcriptional regulator [Deltaproteobacteria bacterium]|nr:GntR family transcriptional regulator [Deltaproteobacteria bacterium]
MATFKTKNKMVYDYIKDAIINAKYAPGEKINPKDLALQLEVSPVPVREAINKLSTEGFLKVIPHIGATVADINQAEVEEMHMIRSELECFAVKLSIQQITEERIRKLERVLDEAERALKTAKFDKFKKLNKQFHTGLYADSSYQLLVEIILQLYNKLQMVLHVPWTEQRAEQTMREHRLILAAVKEKNAEAICKVLMKHRKTQFHELYISQKTERSALK